MADGGKESGSALQKVVLILDALFESDTPIGLAELSQQLELLRQTVHRVVRQLEDLDIIRRDFARDHFSVGARMMRLSFKCHWDRLAHGTHAGGPQGFGRQRG